MNKFTKILTNSYFDSVALMSLAASIKKETKSDEVIILMATDMNKELIQQAGLSNDNVANAKQSDCVIGVISDQDAAEVVDLIVERLYSSTTEKSDHQAKVYRTQDELYKDYQPNLAIISTPGEFATNEAFTALNQGVNVLMFSDNVSIEQELMLKTLAVEKGLLMMGPDCGTSILNGHGYCFANEVRKGNIGVIGASGTGLQEVTVLIDKLGAGITHAIGVGGRDLKESIGGLMTLQALDYLIQDDNSEVILVVSKPPSDNVKEKIINKVQGINKRVILCFIDSDEVYKKGNVNVCNTLKSGAILASLASTKEDNSKILDKEFDISHHENKFIRGLYCGGTLCGETLSVVRKYLDNVHSNIGHSEELLKDPNHSLGHSILDLGDDFFTKGRPHPMIEPTIRLSRILEEAKDQNVGVILLDFELGYGSHEDPVGITLPTIEEALSIAKEEGRDLDFVAYVLGTEKDYQGLQSSISRLEELGVYVTTNNLQAANLAISLVKGDAQ